MLSGTAAPFALLGLIIGAGKRVTCILRALKHRRSMTRLAEFDERQLKDIGLTRNDVFAALDTPLFQDPSRVLTNVAAGRSVPSQKPGALKPC